MQPDGHLPSSRTTTLPLPRDGVQVGPILEIADPEEWKKQRGWYDENGDDDEDEEDESEGGEEDEELEQEIYWDEMDARPAAKVLRGVMRWYHELVEIPGGALECAGSEGQKNCETSVSQAWLARRRL